MSSWVAMALVIVSSLLAAISQMFLKKTAMIERQFWWREYVNIWVISSYTILLLTTFINMQALVYLPYKVVPVIGAISYVFVIMLSKLILKERISLKKWMGAALILAGIIVFNL